MFSTLTGLKFLLDLPLSNGTTDAVSAFSGKIFCIILVLMAFVSNEVRKMAERLMSLGDIVSRHSPFL